MGLAESNTQSGEDFRQLAAEVLGQQFGVRFSFGERPVGHPPKVHKFDLVSSDGRYVGEAKRMRDSPSGSNISGKFAGISMDVLLLWWDELHQRASEAAVTHFIVLAREPMAHGQETVADRYWRMHGHLLGNVELWELDAATGAVRNLSSGVRPVGLTYQSLRS